MNSYYFTNKRNYYLTKKINSSNLPNSTKSRSTNFMNNNINSILLFLIILTIAFFLYLYMNKFIFSVGNKKQNNSDININVNKKLNNMNKIIDNYIDISLPIDIEFSDANIQIYTPTNVIKHKISELVISKDGVTRINIGKAQVINKVIIGLNNKQYLYKKPKINKKLAISLDKFRSKMKLPGPNDPYSNRNIFSRYPYIEWEDWKYQRRFDNIRY